MAQSKSCTDLASRDERISTKSVDCLSDGLKVKFDMSKSRLVSQIWTGSTLVIHVYEGSNERI